MEKAIRIALLKQQGTTAKQIAKQLVDAAPKLDRWQVIAFRPRRTPINHLEIRGKKVDPKDVQFSLLDNGEKAGIYLFIPGFQEEDTVWKQLGYLLLE